MDFVILSVAAAILALLGDCLILLLADSWSPSTLNLRLEPFGVFAAVLP